ncbi:hypothetical protein GCM10009765_41800 [Fodinicola feengrottensis]|uniref:GNAT family N-acetyltransferase n=1 Tax=Fodinicola feengrottensis TaxID=435914 RepID=A0ABP4TH11_9ACTN
MRDFIPHSTSSAAQNPALDENPAAPLAKLGMSYEGQLRENVLAREGWRDSDLYSVLEYEWRGGWR